MRAMPVVSFRLSEEEIQRLEALGINPGPLAKELVQRELRRRQVDRDLERLEEISRTPSKPVAEIVRDLRDEH